MKYNFVVTLILIANSGFPLQIRDLLLMENMDGQHPLEMAGHLGCFKLMLEIMQTEGVYIKKVFKQGSQTTRWIDVTSYECEFRGERRHLHPLKLIAHIGDECLKHACTLKAFDDPIFHTWIKKKISLNIPMVIIWFVFRLTYVLSFMLLCAQFNSYDYDINDNEPNDNNATSSNSTGPKCIDGKFFDGISLSQMKAVYTYVMTVSVFIILKQVTEYILFKRKSEAEKMYGTLSGRKSLVISFKGYSFMYLVTALLNCMIGILRAAGLHNEWAILIDAAVTVICVICVWPLLFFLQLIPKIGPIILSMYGLLIVLLNFMLIFVIMLFPFPAALHRLLRDEHGCPAPHFEEPIIALYSTFTLTLNAYNLLPYAKGSRAMHVYYLHTLLVFNISIMLFNLLIAIMTSTLEENRKSRRTIITVQRLMVSNLIEDKIHLYSKRFHQRRKELYFHKEDGKFYLVVTESNLLK